MRLISVPRSILHLVTASLLALSISACKFDEPGGPNQPGPGPTGVPDKAGRFLVSLLLVDGDIIAGPNRSDCAVPIHGAAKPAEGIAPEAGLVVQIGTDRFTRSDENGVAAFGDVAGGLRPIQIITADGRFTGRMVLGLRARRTDLYGEILQDSGDLDGDKDTTEWFMRVEALPDDSGDRVSDTGERAEWLFFRDGGIHYRHLANAVSDRVTLNEEYFEIASEPFDDLDGDFIADDVDGDLDGDGIANADEADNLPCPGFSHDDFVVEGSKHVDIPCSECHAASLEDPLRCDDCHSSFGRAFNDTPTNPPELHFERRCEQCHIASSPWDQVPGPDGEDHEAFALLGLHLRTDCFSCHEAGNPKPADKCETCHINDAGTDHFKESCDSCHVADSWKPALNTHEAFPLIHGHAEAQCTDCHTPPDYEGVSIECSTCHVEDMPPKHMSAGFNTESCDNCHNLTGWENFNYPHPNWALIGLHAETGCGDCHVSTETYTGLEADACDNCHQTPAFPSHEDQTIFGGGCDTCHTPTGWVPSLQGGIDHTAFWPLENSHATAACGSCHENGTVPNPPTACEGCHLAERPVRHDGFFDGGCEGCHQSSTWAELAMPYDHTPTFPLAGVHLTTDCSNCHAAPTYDAPTDCLSCHQQELPANHYGNDCATCHSTSNWNPTGELNHHTVDPSAFPLTFSHGNLLCSDCHAGSFTPRPTDCEGCHINSQPTGHATAACADCHTAEAWNQPTLPPSDVIHPLAGAHINETCVDCHGNYTNGTGFATVDPGSTCGGCHNIPQNHIPVGTTDCVGCHTVNAWLPATGGHAGPPPTANFPYDTWSGRWFPDNHRSANACADCHTNPNNMAFFSCTTNCHTNPNLSNKDDHERTNLYHYDPTEANNPPNQGGAVWPTGHVGCVKSGCHADGRE